MGRLLIISNRLPLSAVRRARELNFQESVGGLATALSCFCNSRENLWVGWPGIASDRISAEEATRMNKVLKEKNCLGVPISFRDMQGFYYGFCNKTIWPLFHYFPTYTVYEQAYWQAYRRVNQAFCDAVVSIAEPDDFIWVQDYQLMLLPGLLRDRLPNAQVGFFLHIPFPSFELFRLLPWRREILEGLLGADVIGFHTYDYVRHFLSSITRICGLEHSMGTLTTADRVLRVDAFPMGIDYDRYANAINDPEIKKRLSAIRKQVGSRRIILSVDRLDYTKGIIHRLEAFDLFLSQNPQYKEQVTLVLVAVPSRTGIKDYAEMRKQLEGLVGRINGEHGAFGWVPVWYLYRFLPFERLVALYNIADVALVTPLRDGMNLIAKEFIATKTDGRGVLILSEMAGTASELGEAITVNVQNKKAIVDGIKQALEMPVEEQVERNRLMQQRLRRYTVRRWAEDFFDTMASVRKAQQELAVRRLSDALKEEVISACSKGSRRLLLLDYDGTLVPFAGRPEKAGPDAELLSLLAPLAADPRNELVIISGRDKNTIDSWLGNLDVSLVAEHGAWIKQKGRRWHAAETVADDWKEQIRPILELYCDRTPGSSVEEKDFSLVWHYRRADPELGSLRSQELRGAVLNLTENLEIGIFEGSKILEVKNVGVTKGNAAKSWLAKESWDFILAAGDDYTDEDMFSALSENAYSIKVGHGISQARFSVDTVYDLRSLLTELAQDIKG